jgi:hypothetical protein
MKKYKYKMLAYSDSPIEVVEFGAKRGDNSRFAKFLSIPENRPEHQLIFSGMMVQSGGNKNYAYFDQHELVKAYNTIPFNAIDIEHSQEENCGAIIDHVYVDIDSGDKLEMSALENMDPEELRKTNIGAVILAVLWEDRYPAYADIVMGRRAALSMETFYDNFNLLLENGVMVTQEEAEVLGLQSFIEQMMGKFESKEVFDLAHTLRVKAANNRKEEMKVYKYLLNLAFSGTGIVQSPACSQCTLISTNKDECECEEQKMAASTEVSKELYELDLTKLDSYMQKVRDGKEIKPVNYQVTEDLENAEVSPTVADPPSGGPKTSDEIYSQPAPCPQYKVGVEGFEDMWCTFANKQCITAGSRKLMDCHRWSQDEKTGRWMYDQRSSIEEPDYENIEDGNPALQLEAKKQIAAFNNLIDSKRYALEVLSEED